MSTAVVGDGTTTASRLGDRWRRSRFVVVLVVGAVVVAALQVLLTGDPGGGRLDPDSATPNGSRAVAKVLAAQGVEVSRYARVADALDAAGTATTLVVVDADILGEQQLDAIADSPADLVLVEPGDAVLAALAPGVETAGSDDPATEQAGCDDPAAVAAGRATGGGTQLRAESQATEICFGTDGEGAYAVTTAGDRSVRVIGQPQVLQNGSVDEEGNAALALWTLGTQPRLVWLMADPLDAGSAAEVDPTSLLPGWVPWLAVHLLVVAALLALWQGRRLGRLVPEPLPVVVRSAETAEGRANLYRRAGAHDRAAAVLRAGVLRRCATRLELPAATDSGAVVRAVAGATGRHELDVATTLTGPPPRDGATLVRLADDLDALERGLSQNPRTRTAPAVPERQDT